MSHPSPAIPSPSSEPLFPDDAGARRVLVLGAAGRFGQAAVTAFAGAGWQVIAQARRPLDVPLPVGAQATTAPLEGTSELAGVARGASAVVHAINVPYPQWPRLALPLLRHSMELASRLEATLLLPGNVYNFGDGMPAVLREDTPQRPTTRLGELRVRMEEELRQRAELPGPAGLRSLVIRAGDFFGAGRGSWLDEVIVRSLSRGALVYPGPLDRPHAWAYLPDLARAFVALAERSRDPAALPRFGRWHFAGHTATGTAWLDALEAAIDELGLRPRGGLTRRGLPWWVLRLGAPLRPMWRGLVEMSYLWRVPHQLDGEALGALLGPLPTTPLAAALRQALLDLGLGLGLGLGHRPRPAR